MIDVTQRYSVANVAPYIHHKRGIGVARFAVDSARTVPRLSNESSLLHSDVARSQLNPPQTVPRQHTPICDA